MDTKYTIKFAITLLLISFALGEICDAYRCGSLPDAQCFAPKSPTDLKDYIVQQCSDAHQWCPYNGGQVKDPIICEAKPTPVYKLYPGATCETNDDCHSNVCEGKKCKGVAEGEVCTVQKQCAYGFACRKEKAEDNEKKCRRPQVEGQFCIDDYDCLSTHGCLNGKCTKYYSIEDGNTIPYPAQSPALSFCKSGFNLNETCITLNSKERLVPAQCNDERKCIYLDKNDREIVLDDQCSCGYNPNGQKHCKLVGGDFNYTWFVTLTKVLFLNNPNCHTEERGDRCTLDLKYPNSAISEKYQNYTNAKIWALDGHRLVDADKCIMTVLFPEYTPKDKPEVQACAKFSCKDAQDKCAYLKYTENTPLNVTLSDICKKNEYCFVGKDPAFAFYENKDVIGTCAPIEYNFEKMRYPGEKCATDAECLNPSFPQDPRVGHCVNGFCSGYNQTEACTSTDMCWAGLYCNPESKLCEKQKGNDAPCKDTYECQNKYTCYQGKCLSMFYSQPAGTVVEGNGDLPPNFYCEYGLAIQGQCAYTNTTALPDSNTGLIECLPGNDCTYNYVPEKFGQITKKCQCGFGEDGKAYCPKSHVADSSTWKKYFKSVIRKYDNNCHSKSRFKCYSASENALADVKYYEHRLERGHLYDQAVKCAEKVLGSSFLSTSSILIVAFIALLFI